MTEIDLGRMLWIVFLAMIALGELVTCQLPNGAGHRQWGGFLTEMYVTYMEPNLSAQNGASRSIGLNATDVH